MLSEKTFKIDQVFDIMAKEQRIHRKIDNLKEEICQAIEARTMEGVEQVKSELNIAIVRFSAIKASNGFNLSPGYYLPKSQAEQVRRKLKPAVSMTDLLERIEEMCQKKCVVIGREIYQLNPNTLSVLAEYRLPQLNDDIESEHTLSRTQKGSKYGKTNRCKSGD